MLHAAHARHITAVLIEGNLSAYLMKMRKVVHRCVTAMYSIALSIFAFRPEIVKAEGSRYKG